MVQAAKIKQKIFFVVNVDWFFLSHRLPIALKAISKGYDVFLLSSSTNKKIIIESYGIKFIEVPFERSQVNIIKEFYILFRLLFLYFKYKPEIIHHVTLKPIIYGTFVSKFIRRNKIINSISGLGYNFIEKRKNYTKIVLIYLLRFVHTRKNVTIIFQNNDDLIEFKKLHIIHIRNKIKIIKGSGVDLDLNIETPLPLKEKIVLLFPARMLLDKGLRELKVVSELLKNEYYNKITFILAGMVDLDNKSGIDIQYLKQWQDGIYVKWIGHVIDMRPLYQESDIVILPSYREGLPKSLAEACSFGRPIITTDAIGCRECVDDGINGVLVPVKSTKELANAIIKLIDNKNEMRRMGKMGRIKAEKEFNLHNIVEEHMIIYSKTS